MEKNVENPKSNKEPIEREDCPCKRLRCPRHGRCSACKKFHETSIYPANCMKKKK